MAQAKPSLMAASWPSRSSELNMTKNIRQQNIERRLRQFTWEHETSSLSMSAFTGLTVGFGFIMMLALIICGWEFFA
jgi:hypothetical protein